MKRPVGRGQWEEASGKRPVHGKETSGKETSGKRPVHGKETSAWEGNQCEEASVKTLKRPVHGKETSGKRPVGRIKLVGRKPVGRGQWEELS